MMKDYRPPKDNDPFSAILDDIPSEIDALHNGVYVGAEQLKIMNRKREVYRNWIDLHPITKKNLLLLERDGYRIPERASGEEHVLDLV
jgi:hypothetical protein